MFFPIGDDQVQGGHKAIFSYIILIINILVFVYEISLDDNSLTAFTFQYGAVPDFFLHGNHLQGLVTSLFLHGGWAHLLGNMLFLWVFADNIEATIGSFKFVIFYLLGGIAATLFHGLIFPVSELPLIGASGAIAAVLGAYLVLFPGSRIRVWFLLILSSFNVPALVFLGIWIVNQFFSGYGSLGNPNVETSGVAYWAHIGGFIFGLIVGYFTRQAYQPKLGTEIIEDEDEYV